MDPFVLGEFMQDQRAGRGLEGARKKDWKDFRTGMKTWEDQRRRETRGMM